MSLILSPQACPTSATTDSSPVQSRHRSPGLIPLTSYRRRSSADSYGCLGSSNPLKHANGKSKSSDSQRLFDPFLEKYIKPSTTQNHELYFRSLNRQVRIKSFDYYEQYFNHNKRGILKISSINQDAKSKRKPDSPLRQQTSPLGKSQVDETIDVAEMQIPLRRRKYGGDTKVQPNAKKQQSKVVAEILPSNFEECQSSDLINLMSRMIQSLISLNDQSVPTSISAPPLQSTSEFGQDQKNKLLTRYHSRTPPAISIHTYISRLTKFNNFTSANLLTTIYYIDLLSHNFQPYFTLNSWTVHRFLLVATMLAQKSLEDFFFTNDHYARVGGVALTELNFLELDFLNRVDWKLVPAKSISPTKTSIKYSKEVLDLYYWQLVNLMGKNTTEKDNITYLLSQRSEA